RQLSFGAGSGNRLGTRRKCPMGIVKPRRVAPPPPGGIAAQHPAPGSQKMTRLPLISWLFRLVDCLFAAISPLLCCKTRASIESNTFGTGSSYTSIWVGREGIGQMTVSNGTVEARGLL